MRHRLSGRQLSRNAPHRHALMRNMSVALLRHEIGDEPPRKPIRRRLRVAHQPSRQQARAEIQAATETDLED